ncbi:MAG: hypothetical protein WCG97_01465 [bacterium]
MNTPKPTLDDLQTRLAERSEQLAYLAGAGYELLTGTETLTFEEWERLMVSIQTTFNHHEDQTGYADLYRETFARRSLTNVQGQMENPGFADGEQSLQWMNRILRFIVAKATTPREWEFSPEVRRALILEFTDVFLRWCSARGALAHTLFDALAAARFPDDSGAQAMWKQSIIE